MNGIDGMSDESASEQDDDEEEEERNTLPKKRAAASASKKRTSTSTRASSSNKKTTSSSHSRKESSVVQQSHPHALVPVPEWEDRPSKAEYDKLSSKEKRQMRNKISARNFRHRRKAHIDTLEALVNEKDGVIRVLSEEVGTLRVSVDFAGLGWSRKRS